MSNTYKEVGTLKEIGAQVGDVVEWVNSDCTHHEVTGGIGECECFPCHMRLDDEYLVSHDGDDKFRIISRAQTGPVRTVTRHEIVPGVYGNVVVESRVNGFRIKMTEAFYCDPDELTDAIATLTVIRDAMRSNTTA